MSPTSETDEAETRALEQQLEAQEKELERLQENLKRLKETVVVPVSFPPVSCPLNDIQIAYRFLPPSILPAEDVAILDQAVEDGDMFQVSDLLNGLADMDEHLENPLLRALSERALEHEDYPEAYVSDEHRATSQAALYKGIMMFLYL
ncbi:hypothetical protein BDR26DRAFT_930828 [Obelidium mucronatum]|nr:hypothetical protein BDR26DRAFT_930828 [Obelidium mucronatum]